MAEAEDQIVRLYEEFLATDESARAEFLDGLSDDERAAMAGLARSRAAHHREIAEAEGEAAARHERAAEAKEAVRAALRRRIKGE